MSEAVEQPQRSTGRTIFRNTVFGLGAQFALKAASLLFNILVIRVLGGEKFGQYSIVLAWTGLFSVIGDLGITQYLAREIARDRNNNERLFWDTVVLRFLLAILASVVTVGAALLLTDYSAEMIVAIAIFTTGYFFQSLMSPLSSVLTGNERVDLTSILDVTMQVLFMVFAGIVLYFKLSFVWLLIVGVLNLPINIALQYWAIRRNKFVLPRFQIHPSQWLEFLKAGLPFGFIQLSLSFAFRVDTIFLSTYTTDQAIGWYNAAYNLTRSLMIASGAFNTAILPTLAREHALNPEAVRPWYYRSVKIMLFIGLPLAVGGMILSHQVITTLYGAEYSPAAISFLVIVWDLPILMYSSFCGNLTTAIKREGAAARIYGSLGIINVILNLLLIPRFGIVGASFATVLTDLVGAAQFYFLFRREFGAGLGLNKLLRLVLAAVFMGVVVFVLRDFNLFVTIIIGAVSYLLIVWLTGAFSLEERGLLVRLIRTRSPA
jgi:O-antigen/teichoic acid export membrane protein